MAVDSMPLMVLILTELKHPIYTEQMEFSLLYSKYSLRDEGVEITCTFHEVKSFPLFGS
jgi:hypothetical protein